MSWIGDGRLRQLPWLSWGTAVLAAYGLKLHYSRAAVEDLGWILAPTAQAVGELRNETLTLRPGTGWVPPDGSYVIAPACAGVSFMILVLAVSVLCFARRLRSPGQRLAWWLGSLCGAWVLAVAVNTLRILAAVELYSVDLAPWLTPEQAHRLLGTVLYLGALWGVFRGLDRLTARNRAAVYPVLTAAILVVAAYLGMTVVTPLLNGALRHSGGQYVDHAMMVSLVALAPVGALALLFLARRFVMRG